MTKRQKEITKEILSLPVSKVLAKIKKFSAAFEGHGGWTITRENFAFWANDFEWKEFPIYYLSFSGKFAREMERVKREEEERVESERLARMRELEENPAVQEYIEVSVPSYLR